MTTLEKLEPSILYNEDGTFFSLAFNNLHNNYSVYKLTCPDGRVYIGICVGKPEKRWRNGENYNERLKAAYKTYPFDIFRKEVLITGLSEAEALKKEQEFIKEYDSANPEKGFNIQQSSRSDEYCYYVLTFPNGKKYVGYCKLPVSYRWYSSGSSAYKNNPALQEAINQFGWENVEKEVYYDQLDLASAQLLETTVIFALKTFNEECGYNKTYGSAWNDVPVKERDHSTRFRPVRCVETGEEYESIIAAAKATGTNKNSIRLVCNGMRKTAGGWKWEFV